MYQINSTSFDLNYVPVDTPLYLMLTGGTNGWKCDYNSSCSDYVLNAVKVYLETGFIDIVGLFQEDDNPYINELVDAFTSLLCLHLPEGFPIQYWFATLMENWILEQWRKGNTPNNNSLLIDITDLANKEYEYSKEISNHHDYVIAGSYVLSLIDSDITPGDIDVFYTGKGVDFTAGDDLALAIRRPFIDGDVNTMEDLSEYRHFHKDNRYFQYNDGSTICHRMSHKAAYSSAERIKREETAGPIGPKWQFILKKYPSPAHVLISFDIDCCKVCIIGDRIFASPCGYYSIKNKIIKLANNATNYDTLFRILKYVKRRGYGVLGCGRENIHGECLTTSEPTTLEYYDVDLSFERIYSLVQDSQLQEKIFYHYWDQSRVASKFRSLINQPREYTTIRFISLYSRPVILFHPKLRSLEAIVKEVDIQMDGYELAIELVNSFNWTIEPHIPRNPVDFIWYSCTDLMSTYKHDSVSFLAQHSRRFSGHHSRQGLVEEWLKLLSSDLLNVNANLSSGTSNRSLLFLSCLNSLLRNLPDRFQKANIFSV